MRKALIAVIAAAVLFAVGAFAASLTVETENVASGEATVGSCAASAKVVDWDINSITGTGDTADWTTDDATVELTERTGADCSDADVTLAIYSDETTTWTEVDCLFDSGTTYNFSCDFAATPLEVRPIVQVAVLVNGDTFDVDSPA